MALLRATISKRAAVALDLQLLLQERGAALDASHYTASVQQFQIQAYFYPSVCVHNYKEEPVDGKYMHDQILCCDCHCVF